MGKDFVEWHKIKQDIHKREKRPFYNEREVWWCSVGENVGFEMDGKGEDFTRPVLIIKGFSKEVFLCVPITTKLKIGKYYADINFGDGKARKAILSQIRLIDGRRLQEKIITLDVPHFKEIKQAITRIIG